MSRLSRMSFRTIALLNIVLCAVLLVYAIVAGLLPTTNKFGLYGSPIPVFICASAIVAGLFFIAEVEVKEKVRKKYPLILTAVLIVNVVALAVVAYALESRGYTWDSERVLTQAMVFARDGAVDTNFISYIVANPNNIGLLAVMAGVFSAASRFSLDNYLTIAVGINVVLLFASQIFTFFVARMLYGRRIALIALGFSFVFISLSLYAHIPYTDTLTILFPVLLLYLALMIVKAQSTIVKGLMAFLLGVVAIIGYELKPTVLIAFIAILITSILVLLSGRFKPMKNSFLKIGVCIVACVVGVASSYMGFVKYVDAMGVLPYPYARANDNSLPVAHYLNIGMKYKMANGVPYYGGFDNQILEGVIAQQSEQDKVNYSLEGVRNQLTHYGLFDYIGFLAQKINWILSDATFYAYGEGSNSNVVFSHDDTLSKTVRSAMYVNGQWYVLFANALQVIWIALLLLIGGQIVILFYNKQSRENAYLLIPRLMIVGILTFLMFFEGRSRYIYLYVPIFIIVGLYTLSWYRDLGNGKNLPKAAAKPSHSAQS